MERDLSETTVWITGAGSGIGAAMAQAFAAAGAKVALTGRRAPPLDDLAEKILVSGGKAMVLPVDVLDRSGLTRIAQDIAERTGRLDILCNNAGLNIAKRRWADLDWDSWDAVIDINVKGAMNAIAAVLPIMRSAGGGLILNTSSWAGRFHVKVTGAPYSASKHALSAISANINAEEGVHGIRSTALCPAEVATPLMKLRPDFDPQQLDSMIQPEDMAATALYVARMNPNVAVHEIVLSPVRR